MIEIIGGMVSALLAYLLNRVFLKWQGKKSIIYVVPLIEEFSKTLASYFIGGSMIGTHIVFGMIEAIYDLLHTKNERAGPIAAFISIISHGVFGSITHYLYLWTDRILLGIVVVAIIHSLWNYFITR